MDWSAQARALMQRGYLTVPIRPGHKRPALSAWQNARLGVGDLPRFAVAALSLSAAGLIGIAVSEGWEPIARPPVPGDVATGGFGSTRIESGAPMPSGERMDPVRGLILLQRDAGEAERAVRRCAPVPMFQHEFDSYTSLTYNIGTAAFCNSTLARKLNAGDYPGACREILRWDHFQGKQLRGLTLRREREYRLCIGGTAVA